MKTTDNQLDTLIREALSAEDRALFDRLGEPSLTDMLTETYRGRLRWVNLYTTVISLAFFALAVVSAVQIFQAEEVAEMIKWLLGFIAGLAITLSSKVWFWLEMQRHATSREVKRVELAVAHLAADLRSRNGSPNA